MRESSAAGGRGWKHPRLTQCHRAWEEGGRSALKDLGAEPAVEVVNEVRLVKPFKEMESADSSAQMFVLLNAKSGLVLSRCIRS